MVEQFRHGSNSVELEIPGGMIDPADANPEDAAVRELREETGYVGRNARVIGKILPNPAFMSNTCYTVLIEDCRLEREVQFDHAEDIVTQLAPVAEIPQWVASGKIRHALVVVALYHFELLSRNLPKSNAV
jgi:8-oxo-dGTP pyrophosphatase MutT (NUDIX family)